MKQAIETKNLVVAYDNEIILSDWTVSIEKGSIVSIIGANGCGKSTLLKAIGRVIPHVAGNIMIQNQELTSLSTREIARKLAILPQIPQAPRAMTCGELVSYGRFPYQKGLGRLRKEDRDIIRWAFQAVGMEDFYDRPVADLSGGQRQRIWIAMALSQQTSIILLDEPTTYLDMCYQLEILDLLQTLNKEQKTTIVMVLHDINLASRYSDYMIAMKEGKVYSYGTPKDVFTKEMLAECFNIDGLVKIDDQWNKPVCVRYNLLRRDR